MLTNLSRTSTGGRAMDFLMSIFHSSSAVFGKSILILASLWA
jgi:hypothetical protein